MPNTEYIIQIVAHSLHNTKIYSLPKQEVIKTLKYRLMDAESPTYVTLLSTTSIMLKWGDWGKHYQVYYTNNPEKSLDNWRYINALNQKMLVIDNLDPGTTYTIRIEVLKKYENKFHSMADDLKIKMKYGGKSKHNSKEVK